MKDKLGKIIIPTNLLAVVHAAAAPKPIDPIKMQEMRRQLRMARIAAEKADYWANKRGAKHEVKHIAENEPFDAEWLNRWTTKPPMNTPEHKERRRDFQNKQLQKMKRYAR